MQGILSYSHFKMYQWIKGIGQVLHQNKDELTCYFNDENEENLGMHKWNTKG